MQLGMALYDTCTDGLALDTTPEEEQGTIQGFMVGGRAVGSIVSASIVGFLAQNVSWLSVFWVLAGLTLIPLPLVAFIKESVRTAEKRFEWAAFKAFNRSTYLAGGLGMAMFLIILGANQLVNPYLTDTFGINLSAAGMITSLWSLGVVGGSFLGGWLMKKYQPKRSLIIGVILLSITLLTLVFLVTPQFGLTLAIIMVMFFWRGLRHLPNAILCGRHAVRRFPDCRFHVCHPDGLHQHRAGDRHVPERRALGLGRVQHDLPDPDGTEYFDPAPGDAGLQS